MRLFSFCLALTAALQLSAATPPAAQLLPSDTLAVFSVPDWDKAARAVSESAYGKLWRDSALNPVREKFLQRWKEDLAGPLERQMGIKFSDYFDLLHGQVTFAITENGWGTRPDAQPGLLLLIDSKDKEEALKARLSELKTKWIDAGKSLRVEKIRESEFTTLILTSQELKTLRKAFPGPDDLSEEDQLEETPAAPAKAAKKEITLGQSGSLFIAANSTKDIESILARQTGGLAPSLSEQAAYEANHGALFREALGFAWVNSARLYTVFEKRLKASPKPGKSSNPFEPRADRLLAATGLAGLNTIAAQISSSSEGLSGELFLTVPESRRQGIFRLLVLDRKEAGPPPFVGTDVVKFSRWRIDGQKAWSTLESMLTSISPELAGLLQMGLQAAGKDRDPNFDLKKSLVSNLGDDFISLQKNPRSTDRAGLDAPPALFLIGSPNAEQLVQGMKAGTALMPLGGEPDVQEREFLGRKIYSLALRSELSIDDPKGASSPRTFSFAASGGYAAMSADVSTLEEYLRNESSGKSLREKTGLAEAAQKVGGTSTGYFGYENQAETVRVWLESAKRESASLDKLLSLAPLAGGRTISPEDQRQMREWLDVSLLPPFEKISKYFHFLVYSLSSSDEGFSWKAFAPTPPQLHQ